MSMAKKEYCIVFECEEEDFKYLVTDLLHFLTDWQRAKTKQQVSKSKQISKGGASSL